MFKLINSIFNWSITIGKARKLKADPEKGPKSKRFGIFSIICSLLTIAFSAMIYLFFAWIDSGNIVLIVFGLFLGLGIGIGGTGICLLQAIKFGGLQIYINKKPVTWISLAVIILSLIASAIVMLIEFGII